MADIQSPNDQIKEERKKRKKERNKEEQITG